MIPTNSSNKLSTGCDPVSSNCVIWQGPDLPCINLCNGDTISDVIALLAQELCDIIDAACTCDPNINEVVTGCLLADGAPAFTTLDELLNAMIAYMCDKDNFPNSEWVTTQVPLGCLDYFNEDDQAMQGTLSVEEFLKYLAAEVCKLTSSVHIIEQQINTIFLELEELSSNFPLQIPDINIAPTCVYVQNELPGGSSVVTIAVWAVAIETAFCKLRNNVGTEADVQTAISSVCVLGNQPMLSNLGDYGEPTTGEWFSPVTNLAQGQTNIWKILCDMYLAVSDIKDNCCDTACGDIEYGYVTSMVYDGTGAVSAINFNFTPTFVPAGFYDCGLGATITVNDGVNPAISDNVFVYDIQDSALGFDFDVTSLAQSASYNVKVEFCFISTDGSLQKCELISSQDVTNLLTCPSPITLSPTDTTIDFSFTNTLGPNVDYDVYLTNSGAPVTNISFNNPLIPATPIAGTFGTITPLSPGTEYGVYVIITPPGGGPPTICSTTLVTTTTPACTSIEDLGPYSLTAVPTPTTLGISSQDGGAIFNNVYVIQDGLGIPSIDLEPIAIAPPCSTDFAIPCIIGTNLETTEFTCDAVLYTAPIGSTWYFVDSMLSTSGITYYIYAAWHPIDAELGTAELTDVVFCCECPVWLLDQQQTIPGSGIATFDLVSVSFGTPITYSVISNPDFGTVVQTSPGIFTYYNSSTKDQQDAFTVQIDTPCGSTTAVCSVIITSGEELTSGTKFFVVIDTNTIPDALVGADIVAMMDSIMALAFANCPVFGAPPEMYVLPVTDSDWWGYGRMIADKGASASLDATGPWVALRRLPSDWAPGPPTPEVETDDIQLCVFSNSQDGTLYHANTLVTGFALPLVQPSIPFQTSWDDMEAAFNGGIIPTAWWAGSGLTKPQFSVAYRMLLLPVTLGTVGVDSAAKLMNYASLYGTLVPDKLYVRDTGPTDLAPFLKLPAAVLNPYSGTITPGGNTMVGLMLHPDADVFMELDLVDNGGGFDYLAPEFEAMVYDRTITQTCPTTDVWQLTPCPAYVAHPVIYTETDLSAYEIDDKAINIFGVCYEVNQVIPDPAQVPASVIVIADSWATGDECTDCSNFLMTSCDDPAITHITAVNLSAYVASGDSVYCVGAGPAVSGCFTITTTTSAPTHIGTMVPTANCVQCIDCVATEKGFALPIGNWDMASSDVWSDIAGTVPIVDGVGIARADSINGTCGGPTVPVLANAANGTAVDLFTWEADGIPGKGPDAFTGAAFSYLTVANNAVMDVMPATIYVAFAPSGGGVPQDHVLSYTTSSAMNDGWGIKYDGTNFIVWSNAEGTAAYNLTTVGVGVVGDIFILGFKVEAGGITLKEEGLVAQTAVVPFIAPTTDITFGGTPDAGGIWPGAHQAPGRLFNFLYFNEAHSDANMQSVLESMRAKFGI